jgi:hypothetical protein
LEAVATGAGPADIDVANSALDALHDLRRAVSARDEGGSYPIRAAGERNRAVTEAHIRSHDALAECGITDTQAAAMISDAERRLAPNSRLVAYREAEAAMTEAHEEFTAAARSYLDDDG